jgi:phage-related protein
VILALAALAAVIEDLIVWLEGGDSALEKFWEELFGDREEAKKTFKEIKESAETFVKETIPQLKELGSEFKTLINIVGDFFKAISQSTPWKILQHHLAEARRENEKFRDQMQDDIDRQLGKTPDSEKFGGGGGGFEPDPIGETLRKARRSLEEPLLETWENIKRGIDDTLRDIKTLWDDAVKWITDKWNNLKSTASSVCGTIKGAISDLASFIMSSIGGAIDWAIEKWNALKAMVSGGSAFVNHELTASYARAAIGGTTNTSATYNVGSVNFTGATNGRQAAADFSNYLTKQSNNGIRW